MSKEKSITWSTKQVNVVDVRPTPNNYKIKTDLGKERLATSLKMFGLAGTCIVNTDLCLIDGNSRLQEAKEKGQKKLWVSVPSRKLTAKEFKEMSAMYDFAKAGEVDEERIKGELGSAKEFYQKWNLSVPQHLLDKLGSSQKVERSKGSGNVLEGDVKPLKDEFLVQLVFTEKEEKLFRKLDLALSKKFKTESVSQTVLKAYKVLNK